MEFVKYIAGIAIMILIMALLPQSLNIWLRLGIGIPSYYLVTTASDDYKGDGVLVVVLGGVGFILLGGVMVVFWWFYYSIFDPWIGGLTSNYNIGNYVMWEIFELAFVVGLTMMLVAAMVRYKKNRRYQKEKSEAERLADEDELLKQKVSTVKGNWLKKEMITKKLKRQYIEQKMSDQTSAHKQAVSKWDSVYDSGCAVFVFGAVPLGLVLLFCLWWWLTM